MSYKWLQQKLDKRQEVGNYRQVYACHGLIDFTSNDYLGFARCNLLKTEILRECERISCRYSCTGFGSTGSRLLTGNYTYGEELEHSIAQFHGSEEAILFNTGYTANLGLISAVVWPEDTVLFDAQIHASIHDGIQRSKACSFPFRHNDANHLESRLKKTKGRVFVCVESIYSIDGEIAPLKHISDLCEAYGAHLIVDEAHATGVFGNCGEGLVHSLGIQDRLFARVHTFGKALGVHGGVVLGNAVLKNYLVNFSTPYIYTTAMPLHSLAAIKCAYEKFPGAKKERAHLNRLQSYLGKQGSPIISLQVGGNEKTKAISRELALQGFDIRPIMSPTVKKGAECLRLCLHAFNTIEEIQFLIDCLKKQGIWLSLPLQE